MKEDTQSCLWQGFSHSKSIDILNRKLFIFTGKGGTGKTSLALAWAKYLIKKKRKVLLNDVGQNPDFELRRTLKIPYLNLDMNSCMKDYMAHKLGSVIISNWIMDTSFFKSLFKILPSLSYITYLGKIIKTLQEDQSLTIVIDAESSGHALAMLESPFNFKDIFLSGLLVEDLHQIINYLSDQNNTTIFTLCNPSNMAITETQELISKISELGIPEVYPIINNSYHKAGINNPPDFIKKKINLEKKSMKDTGFQEVMMLPHLLELEDINIINELTNQLREIFN